MLFIELIYYSRLKFKESLKLPIVELIVALDVVLVIADIILEIFVELRLLWLFRVTLFKRAGMTVPVLELFELVVV